MSDSDSLWRRDPVFRHTLRWYVFGMLWWLLMVIGFGSTTVVTNGPQGLEERPISFLSRAKWAPLIAIPFAIVGVLIGLVVEAIGSEYRVQWIPTTTILGTLAGGICIVATSPLDGWLAITLPLACLGGGVVGVLVGIFTRGIWGCLRGWEDSQ